MQGQIVTLATVVIPPENTPQKKRTEYLIAHPTWQYKGPSDVISFEWQIGRWRGGIIGFDGITARKYSTFSQPASIEMKQFSTTLPSISLSPLSLSDDPYDCEIWFRDKFSALRVIVENCVRVAEPPVEKKKPEVNTLPAENVTHASATLWGKLIDTGYWNVVDCYFEWGKTTSYGKTTAKDRMYEGDEGEDFGRDISGLTPDTTYHYRAVAVTVGMTGGELTGYGPDRSFTTAKEVVKGFTMKVVNSPSGATQWRAGCVAGGTLPYMPTLQPLSYIWNWTQLVPNYTVEFFVIAAGPWQDGFAPTIQYDQFPFLLRDGKNYAWDFAAHQMKEV